MVALRSASGFRLSPPGYLPFVFCVQAALACQQTQLQKTKSAFSCAGSLKTGTIPRPGSRWDGSVTFLVNRFRKISWDGLEIILQGGIPKNGGAQILAHMANVAATIQHRIVCLDSPHRTQGSHFRRSPYCECLGFGCRNGCCRASGHESLPGCWRTESRREPREPPKHIRPHVWNAISVALAKRAAAAKHA